MSEQINPIVSEKDMGADGKLRKWSTGRKAKWIIWIVVILAAALYALRQSDKSRFR